MPSGYVSDVGWEKPKVLSKGTQKGLQLGLRTAMPKERRRGWLLGLGKVALLELPTE
jgi:hypothetical protein